MQSQNNLKVRRIVSCNGRSWYTNAAGASDYLFNPVFMTFFIMCVVLYATLMQPSEAAGIPFVAQMVVWGGLVMTSLLWLLLSVAASVAAYDRGLTKAIYMPLIMLPLVLINVVVGQFVLAAFNEAFQGGYGSIAENVIQNSIILITLDILHKRFVAPHHPRYVGPYRVVASSAAAPQTASADHSHVGQTAATPAAQHTTATGAAGVVQINDAPSPPDAPEAEDTHSIKIGRETLDMAQIVWIKSEDHYLNIQMTDKKIMPRGKFGLAVKKLGDQFGVQINRSVWVAYEAIRTVDDQKNGHVDLHLQDGTVFTVSKPRLLMFKQNYERFKASVDDGAEITV